MTTIQDYQDKNKHDIKYYRKQMSKYLLTYNQIKEGIQFKEEDIKNLEKEYFEVCPAVHKINKSSSQWTIEDKRKYMADKCIHEGIASQRPYKEIYSTYKDRLKIIQIWGALAVSS